ncbi:response regulator [Caldichromatium japonicum]|uniref:Response regulator n=1 Tax=Caldichromatium japonicum TaxID=2699430 RepID=A0A6G7VCE6_9GAMM|nr:response regulator [Caldichromatium japonicum]QIK37622.1 response regulator [Caldichromatium japonicum]
MARLLVVDDELINLEIIAQCLGDEYELAFAEDGLQAWTMLESHPQFYDGIILDRLMPRMDGIELLKRLKAHPSLRDLPVIMQSAADSPEQIAEGLAAGAWYYLAKPYSAKALHRIVSAALDDRRTRRALIQIGAQLQTIFDLIDQARFRFRTLDEVHILSASLGRMCPQPDFVALGLSELMLNAVEHGNLGIDYAEKGRLLDEGIWEDEIRRRLDHPAQAGRYALIEVERQPDHLRFVIRDQGKGFDWQRYLDLDPARAFDSHGRGIAMARHLAFASLEYRGSGNEVWATVDLTRP